jgi:GH3 auxin-responsive promoter
MTGLFLPLLATYAGHAKRSLVRQTQRVLAAQEEFLLTLLKHQAQTELGQTWQVGEIRSMDQFRDRVPILPYRFYEPFCDRIAQGEANVLNPDPVIYINLTSGSTGKKKQVPVTHRFQKSLRRADLAGVSFSIDLMRSQGASFGKALLTNSICIEGRTSGGINYGPVTAGSIRQGRPLFESVFAVPFEALEIPDMLSRHYVCLLFALRCADLRNLVANFPMLVLRTCGLLDQYAEELIWDLQQGTLGAAGWLKLDPLVRSRLSQRLKPELKRSQYLKEVWRSHGKLTPKLAWQNLACVLTACGGTSSFYFDRFSEYLEDIPVFGGVYGSAEATFGVYSEFNTEGSILAVESGFYEFLPMDQWHVSEPKTLLPSEVKVGEYYRILITSYSGFYRYDIGDVVEVVGFYHEAPLIAFRHRYGGLLSSITEKTTEFHVVQVMRSLQSEFNLSLDDFCVTLSEDQIPARYIVNIELAQGEVLAQPLAFLDRFDAWMGQFNQRYAQERGQIPAPLLRVLAPGSFTTLRCRQVQRGMYDSQLKIPHISEDRQFLKGLNVVMELGLSEGLSIV